MKHNRQASLKQLNSFAVESHARELFQLESERDLQELSTGFQFDPKHDLILGGGSNVLLVDDVDGCVVLNRIKGTRIIREDNDTALLEACGGENWHQLVMWSLERGLSGIENLSLIPGLAGAAPMQNIGAYGVELSDVLESVHTLDLVKGEVQVFRRADCQFGYRDSLFKQPEAQHLLVTHIRLRLQKKFKPKLEYKGLQAELASMGFRNPTAKQVSEAVIRVRRRKLPDPAVTGNAGSFFKNPVVRRTIALALEKDFDGLPVHPVDEQHCRLSAAWMIEHCGWKGRSMGHAGVSSRHALVLVNLGGATGAELLSLANTIRQSVFKRFSIELKTEPRIVRI